MKKFTLFLCFTSTIMPTMSFAAPNANCAYNMVSTVLKEACGGIQFELEQIKKRSTTNAIVTGIGTGAAGGALFAGIKKNQLDEKAAKIKEQMEKIENMSDKEFFYFLKNITAYEEERTKYNNLCSQKRELEAKSKKMGNIRTGLMAGNTATAVAGTIMASKNKNKSHDVNQSIQDCLDTIKANKIKIGQIMMDCGPSEYEKIQTASSECQKLYPEGMTTAEKRSNSAKIISAVNIGTGTVGTITSAAANSDKNKNNDDKKQNLNKAANVLAGTSMLASGAATTFNVMTTKAINDNLDIATKCQKALDEL